MANRFRLCAAFALVACAGAALAQEGTNTDIGTLNPAATGKRFKTPGFSPYAGRNYPSRVYWGDSHLHTAMSLDARTAGNCLGPEEALRFARGEEVVSPPACRRSCRARSTGSWSPTTPTRWAS